MERFKFLPLLGRILIGAPFVMSGLGKLAAYGATVGYIAAMGLPVPPLAFILAVLTELGGGLLLLTGYTAQAYLGMGDPYLFTSVAAVAIGGASILCGSGHYAGTSAGAFVLTILTGLLPTLNLSDGALLIVYGGCHPRDRVARELGLLRSRPVDSSPSRGTRRTTNQGRWKDHD